MAVNTDAFQPRTAWVTVDANLHRPGTRLTGLYTTGQPSGPLTVTHPGRAAVQVTVPIGGMAVYRQVDF